MMGSFFYSRLGDPQSDFRDTQVCTWTINCLQVGFPFVEPVNCKNSDSLPIDFRVG